MGGHQNDFDNPDFSRLTELETELVEVIRLKTQDFPDEFNAIEILPDLDYIGGDSGETLFTDADNYNAAMSALTEEVHNLLKPWYDIPDPALMDEMIQSLHDAWNGMGGRSNITSLELANDLSVGSLLPGYMHKTAANLQGWRGETITALRNTYVSRFEPMFGLQFNTVQVLRLSLEAYQGIWIDARKQIVRIVAAAIDAFDALNVWGNEDNKNFAFDVAAAVAGVVGAMVSGPMAPVMVAVVGGAIGITKDRISVPENDTIIEGSTIDEVWGSMRLAIRSLKDEVIGAENDLAMVVSDFHLNLQETFLVDFGNEKIDEIRMPGLDLLGLPTPAAAVTAVLDSDGNGTVSEKEMGQLDADGDGSLDQSELVDGVDRPLDGYSRPNETDSY